MEMLQVLHDGSKGVMQMALLPVEQKVRTCSSYGSFLVLDSPANQIDDSGQPISPIAVFSSPSLTRVGDSCMHTKICRRLLD
jgi:hypothetical protein